MSLPGCLNGLVIGHLRMGAVLSQIIMRRLCIVATACIRICAGREEPNAATGVAVKIPRTAGGGSIAAAVYNVLIGHECAQCRHTILLLRHLLAAIAEFR